MYMYMYLYNIHVHVQYNHGKNCITLITDKLCIIRAVDIVVSTSNLDIIHVCVCIVQLWNE